MYKPYYILPVTILMLLITSCKSRDDDYTAYFGGEVQNPQKRYVLFSRGTTVLDTIPLDKDNRFFIKFDSLTPGLYSFKHEPEYQYIYFDKNDSLMVSINTNDFDQSIVFSGKGEDKNNFMMDLFLQHEKDRSSGSSIYDMEVPAFMKSIDSAYKKRQDFYDKSKEAIKWSDGFDFYAKSRVDLNYFTKKEYYPYVHRRRTGTDVRQQLPKGYYDHRKNLDFSDVRMAAYSPFMRYYNAMLNNMAVSHVDDASISPENTLRDNLAKLDLADSLFSDEKVKNQVLDNIAFCYLLEDQNTGHNRKFLKHYLKLSTDKDEANEIHKIANAMAMLDPGKKLPEIPLANTAGNSTKIATGKGETVIFFWTTMSKLYFHDMYTKAVQLKKTRPSLNFIAVNVDSDAQWQKVIKYYELPAALQLRAKNFTQLKEKWVFTKLNRAIVLNPDGTIKNAFACLLDTDFEKELK